MLNRRQPLTAALILLAGALPILAAAIAPAHAQSPLGIGVAEPSFTSNSTFLSGFLGWINAHQQAFYRALTGALKAMRENPWNLSGLIGLSFAYGVFHAAGPGHGKAVISSYLIANEQALRRGVVLSFLSALLQGAVAVGLVLAAYLVLRGTGITMTAATQAMEATSFALIAAFGGWLLVRKVAGLFGFQRLAGGHAHAHGHGHGRGDGHAATLSAAALPHGGHDHHHHHHHTAEACPDCGHIHAPDPARLGAERLSLGEAWSAVIAVGLRPCSGALIVMTFAILNGLYLGGVLSVLAMSIGTAITVSILASLAVGAKGIAVRLAGDGRTAIVATTIEILGASLVLVLGLVLFAASLKG